MKTGAVFIGRAAGHPRQPDLRHRHQVIHLQRSTTLPFPSDTDPVFKKAFFPLVTDQIVPAAKRYADRLRSKRSRPSC